MTVTDGETLNMYPNPQTDDGETRLKPYIVVTREWYKEMHSLLSCLHLMANGNYWPLSVTKSRRKLKAKDLMPPNLELKTELIERDLWDWHKFNEPLELR